MQAKKQEFLDKVRQSFLIGDGAFGTMLYAKGVPTEACLEALNLTKPEIIESILLEYKKVGAMILETNSFCLNYHKLKKFNLEDQIREIAIASAQIAKKAAGDECFVAGSIGPIVRRKRELDEYTGDDLKHMFRETMSALRDGGVDLFILETFSRLTELEIGLEVALEFDLPVVCQMAFGDDGVTDSGITPEKAARRLTELGAHVVGANCQIGPKVIQTMIERLAAETALPLSAFPNAGYAQQVDGRYVYGATPEYFYSQAKHLVEAGVTLMGGCCGTGPEHIRAISEAVKRLKPSPRKSVATPVRPIVSKAPESHGARKFLTLLESESFVTVEVEPPKDMNLKKTFEGARMLAQSGCDAFNVPDNPLAQVRMDNMVFADLLRQNIDVPVILHLTCRDKNVIALKADLLGAGAIGIEAILAVTGDPAAIGDQPGSSSVYDINSIGLVEIIHTLNQNGANFAIGVALNASTTGEKGLHGALHKLGKKIQAGANFVETQPIFDGSMIPKIAQATQDLSVPVCFGFMPIVSQRNAEFLHNEVPGIRIPASVIQRFSGLDKAGAEKESLKFSKELIDEAWSHGIRRFYLVPPLAHYALVAELVKYIKQGKSVRRG